MSRGRIVLILAILCSLLYSLPIYAEVPAQTTLIIESVEINGASHLLSDADREDLISALKTWISKGILIATTP